MRGRGLRAKQKRRFRPRTTDSRHLCPIAPNHLAERVAPPARPDEVWQADITYVATQEGWLYVAGVLDACSRKIVGWAADDDDAHRPGRARPRARRPSLAAALRPGCFTIRIAAASMPATPTASCCAPMAQSPA